MPFTAPFTLFYVTLQYIKYLRAEYRQRGLCLYYKVSKHVVTRWTLSCTCCSGSCNLSCTESVPTSSTKHYTVHLTTSEIVATQVAIYAAESKNAVSFLCNLSPSASFYATCLAMQFLSNLACNVSFHVTCLMQVSCNLNHNASFHAACLAMQVFMQLVLQC